MARVPGEEVKHTPGGVDRIKGGPVATVPGEEVKKISGGVDRVPVQSSGAAGGTPGFLGRIAQNPVVRFIKHPAVIAATTLGLTLYEGYKYFTEDEDLKPDNAEADEQAQTVEQVEQDERSTEIAESEPEAEGEVLAPADSGTSPAAEQNASPGIPPQSSGAIGGNAAADPLQKLLNSGENGVAIRGEIVKDLQRALAMSDLSLFFIMHYHDKNGEPQVVDGLGGRLTRLAVLAYAQAQAGIGT